MLRSRFRPLRSREKRTLRHWAPEFVVVVVGILLALLAAAWAEAHRAMAEAEQAVDAMARELQTISYVMYVDLRRWKFKRSPEVLFPAFLKGPPKKGYGALRTDQ